MLIPTKNNVDMIDEKRFDYRHRIVSLVGIILLTIFISRIATFFTDPNFFFGLLELHHFYYGLFLLIVTSVSMLYRRGTFRTHLILTGISIGLILDELEFIMGKVRGEIEYTSTLKSSFILVIILLLVAEFIFYKIEGHRAED
jgi:hypothetical protein